MVTNEDIKAVQQKIDATFEEAERFLRRADGDVEKAVEMIRHHRGSFLTRASEEVKRIFDELMLYYIKIVKKDHVFINMPLLFVGLFLLLVDLDIKIWVSVVAMGIILIAECRVSVYKREDIQEEDIIINKDLKNDLRKTDTPTNEVGKRAKDFDNTANDVDVETNEDNKDDDYYEITIEK